MRRGVFFPSPLLFCVGKGKKGLENFSPPGRKEGKKGDGFGGQGGKCCKKKKTFATFLNGTGMSTLVKKCGENYLTVYNWANSEPVSIF